MTPRLPLLDPAARAALLALLLLGCSGDPKETGPGADGGGEGADGDADDTADSGDGGGDGGDGGGGDGGGPDGWEALRAAMAADRGASRAYAISVAVRKDGELLFAEAIGEADPESGRAATPETLFAIGSTTKSLTTGLLMQQIDAGLISVDDRIVTHLPDWSPALSPELSAARLHDLLTHQGGMVDWLDWAGTPDDADLRADAYGAFAAEAYKLADAGELWNYSNPNFSMAALLSETIDVEGRAWADMLQDDLMAPLGMARCTARGAEAFADGDYSVGNGIGPGGRPRDIGPDTYDPAFARPAGFVWCTPREMTLWGEALLGGAPTVLPEAGRLAMTTPQVDLGYYADPIQAYGYALFIDEGFGVSETEWSDKRRIDHGGNTLGHTSALVMIPEDGVVVSVLIASYGADLSATVNAALQATDALGPLREGPTLEPDPSLWADFVGDYTDAFNAGPIRVSEEDGTLVVDCPLLDSVRIPYERALVPYGPRTFLWTVQGQTIDLSFLRPTGETEGPTKYIRNRSFVATRDAAPTLAPRASAARPRFDPSPLALPPGGRPGLSPLR
jgi:CubicO group peptidase (beta-lactamase class C family)